MNVTLQSYFMKSAVIFFMGVLGSVTALAQGFRTEATYSPNFSLVIPAIKVADKYYEARLFYQDSSWVLASAINISPIDDDYLTGSYQNDVLDLACVNANGGVYSAKLASTAPGKYAFTLVSSTRLTSCPLPPGIGPARGKWVRTAESPLSARNDAALAWTGKEIIVFGGWKFFCPPTASCIGPSDPPFRDGAAYNPLTDSWRKIADAPAGITGNSNVTVGSDIFVFGRDDSVGSAPRLLQYRSSLDRWDAVELPANLTGIAMAAAGSNVLVYDRTDERGSTGDWLFNTTTTQWTQLPEDPLGPSFNRQYVALGDDLYLFAKALTASPGGASGPSYLRAARLRGQQWSLLPAADSIGAAPDLIAGKRLIAPILGCADGGRTNGYGRCIPYGAVFDTATDTWQALPNAPGRGIKYFESSGGFSDSDLTLRMTGRPALDAMTNEWFLLPLLDADRNTQRSLRATGPYGFAFGGASSTGEFLKDAWIWKP